ncbi:hypothetical protein FSP39_014983 [Pinctada imbricata]|uniref:PLAT domain-containing protein n=1 Tax=Pinctada imbricata TaxID=66713 RepID=A0AA88YED8_PINIB|nr:hypothetical protein FSP39_014983 [Pinctada imbricata]
MALHSSSDFKAVVKTGDRLFAGTDACVKVIFHNFSGDKSDEVELDNIFKNDFEQGSEDHFYLKNVRFSGDIDYIELWRDNEGIAPAWLVEWIEVLSVSTKASFVFPIFRWIQHNRRYYIKHLDTTLPQDEMFADQRKWEIEEKRSFYELKSNAEGLPAQVWQQWNSLIHEIA